MTPQEPEYHEVPYTCAHCGRFARALGHKACGVDQLEMIHALLVCNRCADLLTARNREAEDLARICETLTRGVVLTKDGHRKLTDSERADLEKARTACNMRLRNATDELANRKCATSAR